MFVYLFASLLPVKTSHPLKTHLICNHLKLRLFVPHSSLRTISSFYHYLQFFSKDPDHLRLMSLCQTTLSASSSLLYVLIPLSFSLIHQRLWNLIRSLSLSSKAFFCVLGDCSCMCDPYSGLACYCE